MGSLEVLRVLKLEDCGVICNFVLGVFWVFFGGFLGVFWGFFGGFLGVFWGFLGVFGVFWGFLGFFWDLVGDKYCD